MGVNVMGTWLSNMLNNELMVSVMYPPPPAGDLWGYFVTITRAGVIKCPHLIVGIVSAK